MTWQSLSSEAMAKKKDKAQALGMECVKLF